MNTAAADAYQSCPGTARPASTRAVPVEDARDYGGVVAAVRSASVSRSDRASLVPRAAQHARAAGSLALEVLLNDPGRLPLVGPGGEVVEPHVLRLGLLDRQRLRVAHLLLPVLNQGQETLEGRGVGRVGGQVFHFVRAGHRSNSSR